MTFESYDELIQEMIALAREGDVSNALDILVEESAPYQSDHERMILYYQMNLLSMLGRKEEAVSTLQKALDQGYWYSPSLLREDDEDLSNIVNEPQFQSLRQISIERYQTANRRSAPGMRLVPPRDESIELPPLCIALHGNNSNASRARQEWMGVTKAGWYLAVLQSSQIEAENTYVWNDIELAEKELSVQYKALADNPRFDISRLILGGFSMGGGLAAHLSLSEIIPVQGFILVAPYFRDVQTLRPYIENQTNRSLSAYIIVGEQDKACIEGTEVLAEMMGANNLRVTLDRRTNMGHAYPDDFDSTLERALNFVSNI